MPHDLPAHLDLEAAPALKKVIATLLRGGEPATLDLSHVERASFAAAQLVLAGHIEAQKNAVPLNVILSDAMQAALRDLGFTKVME